MTNNWGVHDFYRIKNIYIRWLNYCNSTNITLLRPLNYKKKEIDVHPHSNLKCIKRLY